MGKILIKIKIIIKADINKKDKILDFKNEEHNCKKKLFLILKIYYSNGWNI